MSLTDLEEFGSGADPNSSTSDDDLGRLAELGLLHAQGETRGRYYTAGEPLRDLRAECRRRRRPVTDPYPWMRSRLAEARGPRPTSGPAGLTAGA
ncbi:hypothetical protein EV385_3675 [Krasilnikovia cinnamomea]|uniref:Uncharacterized protein n=1 Tax=Krasilnikovia cinnamomea TaxID=349313 RepID=A0A4Q7ZNH2_9ACTN|nr:hypothetical protein EV385_3675 [Krasilnikovia cinnamomea]